MRLPNLHGVVRLIFALACLLFALLAVVPAQSSLLWQLTILVTELGGVLALIPLIVLVPGWRATRAGRVAAVAGILACLLMLSPMVRGVVAARAAERVVGRAFGGSDDLRPGLPFGDPEAVTPETFTYVTHGDVPVLLDYYRAVGGVDSVAPALVVVIHGGSWRGGDRTQLPQLNWHLARRGYAVAAIEYRLAPAHTFPAALEDVGRAVDWLKLNARDLGFDSGRIVLLGRSAGGHLALLAAYTLRDPAVRGAVSLYGPTDLRWGWNNPANPRVIDSRGTLRRFLGGSLSERGAVFDQASPVRFTGSAVPTLLIHGTRDELVSYRHSQMLADSLDARHIRNAYVQLPWATHACDYFFRGPCGRISTWSVEQFLTRVTARNAS